jgi:hypothetical protein
MGLAKPLKTKLENIANAAVSFSKSEQCFFLSKERSAQLKLALRRDQ